MRTKFTVGDVVRYKGKLVIITEVHVSWYDLYSSDAVTLYHLDNDECVSEYELQLF